jgi:hypothetical protein
MTEAPTSDTAPEPIAPAEARAVLERAMAARLGADWQEEGSGWLLVTGNDYMARVTRGKVNIDFLVDLLGEVSIEEKPLTPSQTSGRLIAWTLLLLALAIVYLLARALGWV